MRRVTGRAEPDDAAKAGGEPNLRRVLRRIVGRRHVLAGAVATRRYITGFRVGAGPALAVVRPGSLMEFWLTLHACMRADVIVVMQSANTGLTGGSTPNGTYDRDVVIINTMRIRGIHPIEGGKQVICLPGATLHELEIALAPWGREPHSVIGSSCIGASVLGGICNNSGGALVQRGPAYTELALFARLDDQGELVLVNHLGVALGESPAAILGALDKGSFRAEDVEPAGTRKGSDGGYCAHVRQVDADTPARFNADPARLYEASGSAGRVALFAVRLDTFPKEAATSTFYIGTNSVDDLTEMRRDILSQFATLPISGEYVHREAFDIAARYGKDTVVAIERLGTRQLPTIFGLKSRIDAIAARLPFLPTHLGDRMLQGVGRFFGDHLPPIMRQYRDRFEHHLILKMGGDGINEARRYLKRRYANGQGDFFECSPRDADKAFLHRFAIAGAAMRYQALHSREVEGVISLDIALRRNDGNWFERLPDDIGRHVLGKLYYAHFLCHVFHHDYIIAKGADLSDIKRRMLEILDVRGAEYPAEHNVGHIYKAKRALADHYRSLDPCNVFNPGLGDTSRSYRWR